jgi:protein-ribulosamine 3-kinase
MNDSELWQGIAEAIASGFKIEKRIPLSGGSINAAFRIEGGKQAFFVKLNRSKRLDMFEAEFEALREIGATATVRVPEPLVCGVRDDASFLVLELLTLKSPSVHSDRILGEQLAAMHGRPQLKFGWTRDNTIGSTPQENNWSDSWIDFWRDQRLAFQLNLARTNGYPSPLLDRGHLLCENVDSIFDGYSPTPSLLHGDLWSGNAAADETDQPVIFDPACYYGDRECDIAMSELFGGFGNDFYRAYDRAWPLDPGYRTRKTLYNLYHVLNHFNLFGGGYQRQADSMIRTLLAEIR